MHWQGDVDVGARQHVAAGVAASAVEQLSVVPVDIHGTLQDIARDSTSDSSGTVGYSVIGEGTGVNK